MENLPELYIIDKFYQYAGYVKHNSVTNIYNGGCPICREGKSWGKKARASYIPKYNIIKCFNCDRIWDPIKWICEVSGMTYHELMYDVETSGIDVLSTNVKNLQISGNGTISDVSNNLPTLPDDAVCLNDSIQYEYYSYNKAVNDALDFIKRRRLDTAINRPKSFYISLTDLIHKNRLVIPFYDYDGKLVYYQTRAIYAQDEIDRPKYLSKQHASKTLYGIDNISSDLDYIFILEGPIDAMFVPNGVGMCGLSLTNEQQKQLDRFYLHKKIWVFDNQLDNEDVKRRVVSLMNKGELVFMWPKQLAGIKDFNELCVKANLDKINPDMIIKNSHRGLSGMINL